MLWTEPVVEVYTPRLRQLGKVSSYLPSTTGSVHNIECLRGLTSCCHYVEAKSTPGFHELDEISSRFTLDDYVEDGSGV